MNKSLIYTSTAFFYIYINSIFAIILYFLIGLKYEAFVLGAAIDILPVSLIALMGSLFFIIEMKQKSKYGVLGIPLCTLIATIPVILYKLFLLNELFFKPLLVLIAPCSVLFFLSVPIDQRNIVKYPVIITTLISIYIIISYCFFLDSSHMTNYSLICFPAIGICLLLVAKKLP